MPRQIIDTESSRPAYVRRKVSTWVLVVLIAVAVAAGVWAWHTHQAASAVSVPGNSGR